MAQENENVLPSNTDDSNCNLCDSVIKNKVSDPLDNGKEKMDE